MAATSSMKLRIPYFQNGSANKQVMLKIYTVNYPAATPKLGTILNENMYIKNVVFSSASVSTCSYSSSLTATTNVQQTSNAKVKI